jgi:hypothetical protein
MQTRRRTHNKPLSGRIRPRMRRGSTTKAGNDLSKRVRDLCGCLDKRRRLATATLEMPVNVCHQRVGLGPAIA